MIELALEWLDFLWIPFVLIFVRKKQKFKAVIFILVCILALRLQVDLMTQIDYPTGILPWLSFPILYRGYIVYAVFISVFLGLAHISKEQNPFIYMAAGISVSVFAFIVSIAVMCL